MRPLIAIAAQLELDEESYAARRRYAELLMAAGGCAVVVVPTDDEGFARILDGCDGLLLAGGADVEATHYGEQPIEGCDNPHPARDEAEMRLVRMARERSMPFLGICRGAQLANVAYGGTLHQRLDDVVTSLDHWQPEPYDQPSHPVKICEATPLADILGAGTLSVNSMHHQAVKTVASNLAAAAHDPHGVVEALYDPAEDFFMGVQWHPEYAPQLETSKKLASAFIAACARYHDRSRGAGPDASATENHLFTDEYVTMLQKVDPHGDDRRRIWTYLEGSTSVYDGQTVYSSALPRLFDQVTYNTFERIAGTTYRILAKVIAAYVADPAYRELFGYDPRAEELILLPSGYDEPLPLMRVDVFLNENTLDAKLCELNSDGSSGMNENREITIGVEAGEPFKAFAQHHRVQDCNDSLFDGWVDEFLRIYSTTANAVDAPNVAIVDFLDHAVVEEFKIYGRLFQERGLRFAIYDVRELTFDGQHLRGRHAWWGEDGLVIDAAWRRCISTDVIAHWDESQPLIEAVRQRKTVLIGSFAGHIVHDKRISQALMDPRTSALLTEEENRFLAGFIPRTIVLAPGCSELDEVRANRTDWVIKPTDSYGSQDVHIGLDCTDDEWERIVGHCASQPDGQTFLAQRFCEPFPTPAIPLYGNEEDYQRPPMLFKNLSGLFVYSGRLTGVFSRQGPQNIILGKKGGVTAPSIWVDVRDDARTAEGITER